MTDGLINFLKPVGISSAKALYRVRSITGIRKSGHAGTLDPAADGVLILCLGRGTKLVESLMDLPKVYRATARLDVTSESFDRDRPMTTVPVAEVPSEARVAEAAATFVGEIMQVPPTISAIKVGGQPAYKLERAGKTVTLPPRPVRVYSMQVLRYDWPKLSFEMKCGRGTYVRALIRDWGAQLGCGGCLTTLTRTAIGPFSSDDSWTFDRLETAGLEGALIPLETARKMIAAGEGCSFSYEKFGRRRLRRDSTPPQGEP